MRTTGFPTEWRAQASHDRTRSGRLWLSGNRLWGGYYLLVGAAALGLVASLGWVCEGSVCERLDTNPAALAERDAALEGYLKARCDAGQCESIKVVSSSGCRAKVRVVERRFDDYGDVLGSFRADEGLEFSPMLDRWRLRETLVDKQVLGLPSY